VRPLLNEGPTRFLEHPELELSNNLAGNLMRPVALGRKNWIQSAVHGGPRGCGDPFGRGGKLHTFENLRSRLSGSDPSRTRRSLDFGAFQALLPLRGSASILASRASAIRIRNRERLVFSCLSENLSRERWQLCVRRGCNLWLWRPPRSQSGAHVPPWFCPAFISISATAGRTTIGLEPWLAGG